jgi:predicted transporter
MATSRGLGNFRGNRRSYLHRSGACDSRPENNEAAKIWSGLAVLVLPAGMLLIAGIWTYDDWRSAFVSLSRLDRALIAAGTAIYFAGVLVGIFMILADRRTLRAH